MATNPARTRKQRSVQVTFDQAAYKELQGIAKVLKCSIPEVLRRGVAAMRQHSLAIQAGVGADQLLAGDALTIQAKQKFIQAVGELKGEALAAKDAGVSLRTVRAWYTSDEVFREMISDANAEGVEDIEQCLVAQAKKGQIAAIFGVLNAKHPDYGQIRTQLLQRVLGPLLDQVIRVAAQFLQPADLQRFATAVGREAETVALEASAGGKRR